MEKVWAQRAGLGWQGKHTNLITRDYGSWLFLGEIILSIELEYDSEFEDDLCGSCTACIDACPTSALTDYVLDARKCISYMTIEHRAEFSAQQSKALSGWIFGCDICQEVCPWNKKHQTLSPESEFLPIPAIKNNSISQWIDLTEDEFRLMFRDSPVKRTKFKGFKRNIFSVINSDNLD
jgi:epoxyqueuosine reductase